MSFKINEGATTNGVGAARDATVEEAKEVPSEMTPEQNGKEMKEDTIDEATATDSDDSDKETVIAETEDQSHQAVLKEPEISPDDVTNAKWMMSRLASLYSERIKITVYELEEVLMLWAMVGNDEVIRYFAKVQFFGKMQHMLSTSKNSALCEVFLSFLDRICERPAALTLVGKDKQLMKTVFYLLNRQLCGPSRRVIELFTRGLEDVVKNKEFSTWAPYFKGRLFDKFVVTTLKTTRHKDLGVACINMVYLTLNVELFEKTLIKGMFDLRNLVSGLLNFYQVSIRGKKSVLSNDCVYKWLEIITAIMRMDAIDIEEYRIGFRGRLTISILAIMESYKNEATLAAADKVEGRLIIRSLEIITWMNRQKVEVDPQLVLSAAIVLHVLMKLSEDAKLNDEFTECVFAAQSFWTTAFMEFDTRVIGEVVYMSELEVLESLRQMLEITIIMMGDRAKSEKSQKIKELKWHLGVEM